MVETLANHKEAGLTEMEEVVVVVTEDEEQEEVIKVAMAMAIKDEVAATIPEEVVGIDPEEIAVGLDRMAVVTIEVAALEDTNEMKATAMIEVADPVDINETKTVVAMTEAVARVGTNVVEAAVAVVAREMMAGSLMKFSRNC